MHSDGIGCAQYMIHIQGKKLWLFWPPSPANLEFYAAHHTQVGSDSLTLSLIHKLEGLQLHYFDNTPTAFVVPPNYLHAVISFTMSAHAGIFFFGYPNFPEALHLMRWFIDWAKQYTSFRHTITESCAVLQKILDEGVQRWISLLHVNENHERNTDIIKELKTIEKEATQLLTTLSDDGQTKPQRKQQKKV